MTAIHVAVILLMISDSRIAQALGPLLNGAPNSAHPIFQSGRPDGASQLTERLLLKICRALFRNYAAEPTRLQLVAAAN